MVLLEVKDRSHYRAVVYRHTVWLQAILPNCVEQCKNIVDRSIDKDIVYRVKVAIAVSTSSVTPKPPI